MAALAGCLWAAAPECVAPTAAASEGAAGEDVTARLNPLKSWREDLAVWTAVVFVLVLLVLWKYAWGPIAQGLQKREQAIADQIAQAERNNQDAQRLLSEYQEKLTASGQEVRRMIEQARHEAEAAGRQIVDQARQDAQAERQKAVREIESATAGAIKDLSEHAADLAVDLAGKIVGAELKPGDHAKLIEQTVARFSQVKAGPSKN